LRCQSPIPARARGPSATRADLNNRISPVLGKLWHLNFYIEYISQNQQTNKQRNKQINKETNKANKQTTTTTTTTTTKYKQSFIILGKPDTIQAWRYQIYLQPGQPPTCRVKQVRQAGSGTDRQVGRQAQQQSKQGQEGSINPRRPTNEWSTRTSFDRYSSSMFYIRKIFNITCITHTHTHTHTARGISNQAFCHPAKARAGLGDNDQLVVTSPPWQPLRQPWK
jgi:hypothetical protein